MIIYYSVNLDEGRIDRFQYRSGEYPTQKTEDNHHIGDWYSQSKLSIVQLG